MRRAASAQAHRRQLARGAATPARRRCGHGPSRRTLSPPAVAASIVGESRVRALELSCVHASSRGHWSLTSTRPRARSRGMRAASFAGCSAAAGSKCTQRSFFICARAHTIIITINHHHCHHHSQGSPILQGSSWLEVPSTRGSGADSPMRLTAGAAASAGERAAHWTHC